MTVEETFQGDGIKLTYDGVDRTQFAMLVATLFLLFIIIKIITRWQRQMCRWCATRHKDW